MSSCKVGGNPYQTSRINSRPIATLVTRIVGWIAASALLSAGCQGSDVGEVTGKALRRDGTPLVGARVIARSVATGKSATASTDSEGQFELTSSESTDGIPPGEYRVIIMEDRDGMGVRPKPTIAAKYGNATYSGLTFVLEAGEAKVMDLSLDPPVARR